MTTQATRNTVTGWRRKFAGGLISAALAAGLGAGAGPAPARADVLDDLAQEFSVGSGAGQVANLLKGDPQAAGAGYRPSRANLDEITKALSYRPNQKPLIEALGTRCPTSRRSVPSLRSSPPRMPIARSWEPVRCPPTAVLFRRLRRLRLPPAKTRPRCCFRSGHDRPEVVGHPGVSC